jgi:hypothetical protein
MPAHHSTNDKKDYTLAGFTMLISTYKNISERKA